MFTIADFRREFEGLPDDTPVWLSEIDGDALGIVAVEGLETARYWSERTRLTTRPFFVQILIGERIPALSEGAK